MLTQGVTKVIEDNASPLPHRPLSLSRGTQEQAKPGEPMFVRVATTQTDWNSYQNEGVFQRAYDLYHSGKLEPDDASRLEDVLNWFERNLPLPDRSKIHPRAIFWFKPAAGEPARRIWQLAARVKKHEATVQLLKTRRPGYILYEDDFQVAAVPFRDTFKS
jgi:hypothetical protein